LIAEIFLGEQMILEVFCERQDGRAHQQLKINGQGAPRGQFVRQARVISFLPEDLNLLTHSPASRRRFFDETLAAGSPDYRHALSQYNKALKQRSEALEKKADLEIWDEQLVNFGSIITRHRQEFISFAESHLKEILKILS
ncbi:MAG: hypothetical protein Q8R08_04975, partial [bacterium]|nr:hypothetical protein [bacterium]